MLVTTTRRRERHVARPVMLLGVAQPSGGHPDKHLAGPRLVELDVLDLPVGARLVQHRRLRPHVSVLSLST